MALLWSRQLEKIKKGKLWKFFGGLRLDPRKLKAPVPIEHLKLPSLITLPLKRHLGEQGRLLVKPGERVKRGQALTAPVDSKLVPLHASTSGIIVSISDKLLPHPSGFSGPCVVIKPDGQDEAADPEPVAHWEDAAPNVLLQRIRSAGVEGMGGALFQTEAKLRSCLEHSTYGCHLLIANGCECEPVLSCDDALMQLHAEAIVTGLRILKKILNPELTLIAIEKDRTDALGAMRRAAAGVGEVRAVPSRYPAGSERNLIKVLTGVEIPYPRLISENGIVVNNVATLYAVKEAVVDGLPVTRRVVTVAGANMAKHGNLWITLGTSVRFVLSNYRLNPQFHQRIIIGGPMTGFTLPSIDVPVIKSTSCILAAGNAEIPRPDAALPCIRCGRCARVCPSRLVPYKMYAYSRSSDHGHARSCGIGDCILCGCCAYVCPSCIPLTGQFRREKVIQKLICEAEARNAAVKEHMAAHEQRLAEEQAKKAARRAAALARIQARDLGTRPATTATTAETAAAGALAGAVTAGAGGTTAMPDTGQIPAPAAGPAMPPAHPGEAALVGAARAPASPAGAARAAAVGIAYSRAAAAASTAAKNPQLAKATADLSIERSTVAAEMDKNPGAAATPGNAGSARRDAVPKAPPVKKKRLRDPLPYSLRRGGVKKHARTLPEWEKPADIPQKHEPVGELHPDAPPLRGPAALEPMPIKHEPLPPDGSVPPKPVPPKLKKLRHRH